jgi:hypothetical protein
MKKSRFTESQIVGILEEVDSGIVDSFFIERIRGIHLT